jgi:hypothetical protein
MTRLKTLSGFGLATFAGLLLAAAPVAAQIAPEFGTAGSFAVLGGSGLTNTGPSVAYGDIGVSPGTSVIGFPPGIYSGILHAADGVAQQAQSDLIIAYDMAAGQPFDDDLTGQDLGNMTLTPGVYRFSSSAQLTGTLTLDAQGDPAAVFIFQIGSTLTTASNAVVSVINGGSDCNVFWQVGTSATLGTTTEFAGNIIAMASITANTGANVSGRLLARNGAVTLDSTSISACATGGGGGIGCPAITLLPATLQTPIAGSPYNQGLTATGGTAPYVFTRVAGSLPPGIVLSSTGQLSGTPTTSGSFSFTVRVTDANGCIAARTYTMSLSQALPTQIPTLPPLGLLLLASVLGLVGWASLRRA